MKKLVNKLWPLFLTLLFGIVVFLFWRVKYPHALAYQEQFQLFMTGTSYFKELLAMPGGFARYVSEFLVQFNNVIMLGAAVMAILFMLVQVLTWLLMRSNMKKKSPANSLSGSNDYYPLSFLPALSLWYTLGDESVLMAFVVSLLCCMLAMLCWPGAKHDAETGAKDQTNAAKGKIRGTRVLQILYAIIAIPVVYWLAGPLVWMFSVYAALRLVLDGKSKAIDSLIAGCLILYTLARILLSARFVNYPLDSLMMGLCYYRFVLVFTMPMIVTAVLCVFIPLTARFLPANLKPKRAVVAVVAQLVLIVLCTVTWVPRGFDAKKYELIEYDYLVRVKDWKGIIAKAEQKTPDLPMSVSATNLALAMTGQLGDRAFEFYQRGHEGLLPPFERNFTGTQLTGEIYFHLGLVNTAQRFAFESMEALPDFRKSARSLKRLAETNLINGQYDVARKYLQMLKRSMFYRSWAERTEALLGHEKEINEHPLYGWLRKVQLKDDFLFSEDETDKICGQLFLQNKDNLMAVQYLLMLPLLDRDINRFMQYAQIVQSQTSYKPRAVQEAMAFAYMQNHHEPPQDLVSPEVTRAAGEFIRVTSGGAQPAALEQFRGTAWYYLVKN